METIAMLTFSDGKLDVPAEVQEKLHLSEGDKIRLVLASDASWIVTKLSPPALPEWEWEPNEDWRSLQGILSDHPEHDTTKVRAEERAWELEHDERKFGPFPKL